MHNTSKICLGCGEKRSRNAFLRPFKQRVIEYDECTPCFEARLLRNTSGRAIATALYRGLIDRVKADVLLQRLEATRAEVEAQRKAKLRETTLRMWAERRFKKELFGIEPIDRDLKLRTDVYEAHARQQAERIAAYEEYKARVGLTHADIERWEKLKERAPERPITLAEFDADKATRAKLSAAASATMTGKKRGPYVTAKQRIRADAQKKRVLALIDTYEKEDTGEPAPAGNGQQE